MTALEILLSIICPLLFIGWACAYAAGRVWRHLAEFWRAQAVNRDHARNTYRTHPLRECIRRAAQKHQDIRNGRIPKCLG